MGHIEGLDYDLLKVLFEQMNMTFAMSLQQKVFKWKKDL
jgi:hypothetical protein